MREISQPGLPVYCVFVELYFSCFGSLSSESEKNMHSFLFFRRSSWISLITDGIKRGNSDFLATFQEWLWLPGTCFLDEQLWWGRKKKRYSLHEGVDLACYANQQGQKCWLEPGLAIPSIFSGKVVQFHQDFLNWSVYIRHEQFYRNQAVLHTVYGHIQPWEGLCLDQQLRAGEPVALLDASPRSGVPLHLHCTVAWIPQDIPAKQLSWQMLSEHERIILLDPLLPSVPAHV